MCGMNHLSGISTGTRQKSPPIPIKFNHRRPEWNIPEFILGTIQPFPECDGEEISIAVQRNSIKTDKRQRAADVLLMMKRLVMFIVFPHSN